MKKYTKVSEELCPALQGIFMLRGKWTLAIIHNLLDGKKRFNELEREVVGISTRMLVKELKSLQKYKIVRRKAYATVPPTVEYSLTEKGKSLESIINNIGEWADEYVVE